MAQKIHRLPPALAERIAAGEVIERPASVIKELVENSIDAGATRIEVQLEEGGKGLIEITDNGTGMAPADLLLCIERHATSKLSRIEDLENITSLGFRGEALASVAAVSELEIISRAKPSQEGEADQEFERPSAYQLQVGDIANRFDDSLFPSKITFGNFLGSDHGTQMRARNLFSQIPARLKFLKSQTAEVSLIKDWIEKLALSHPEIQFGLLSNGKQILKLEVQTEGERILAILADDATDPLVSDQAESASLRVKAHWIRGLSTSQSKKIIQIVNGRVVKDKLIQQAVSTAFRQALLPGQFPAVCIFLEIHPHLLDVNVHPAKTEVRFLDSGRVFKTVEQLLQKMLRQGVAPVREAFSISLEHAPPSPLRLEECATVGEKTEEANSFPDPLVLPGLKFRNDPQNFEVKRRVAGASDPDLAQGELNAAEPLDLGRVHPPQIPLQEPLKLLADSSDSHPSHYLGSFLNTYLIFETNLEGKRELILVDQHAAHERVRYERLRGYFLAHPARESSQGLIFPETISYPKNERDPGLLAIPVLQRLGFEVEDFDEGTLLVRAIPSGWGNRNLKLRIRSLLEKIFEAAESGADLHLLDEFVFEKIASEACRGSVMAGDPLDPIEAEELMKTLLLCKEPWSCPHGRPTLVRFSERKVLEWFQR